MTFARHSAKGTLLILSAALLWSTGGFFIKSISLDGYAISFWRSSFAAITLFLFYRKIVPLEVRSVSSWLNPQTLLTAFVYSALLILFVLATKLTTSANAIFLQFTAPIYVLFFEPIINKTKLRGKDVTAVLITIGAMILFFLGKFDASSVLGNILALTSGIFFAAYTLLLKHERTGEAGRWQSVIIGHIMIVTAMSILALSGHMNPAPASIGEFGMLLFLGVMQIGLPYSLFTIGIHSVSALDALLLSMVEPVLNPVWVFIGIGEEPSGWALIGGSIILSMVATRAWLAYRAISATAK
jgi:drug/metabolite transporter (DMT)-like permease